MPILKSGCFWRVGNGEKIRVRKDRWIPNYPSNKVLHPVAEEVKEQVVSELIDPDLHCWRPDFIMENFQRDDANAICKIPLSQRRVADSVVWMHTKNEASSVQSGYHIARKMMTTENWAESSRSAKGQLTWKALWRLKVPSKLKVFGWRACHQILPTRVSLAKRKILDDDKCHCCKRITEIAIHAVWECGAVQDVQAGSITSLQKWTTNCHDFRFLFECLIKRLPREELEHFLVQAWMIWNQRNAVIHGRQLKEPGWLNRRAEEFLYEYRKAQVTLMPTNVLAGNCV